MPTPLEMAMQQQVAQAPRTMVKPTGPTVRNPLDYAQTQGPASLGQAYGGAQGGQPLAPQPPANPQGSYQQQPSAYNDALTSLFNASSGIDTSQLDAALAAINDNAARQSGQVAAQTVSQALGSGAAGTPVAALANTAAGDVLSQANAQSQQTALNYLLGRSGQNIGGLANAVQLGLAGENQAFNQGIAAQNQQFNALGMLMQAGALPRQLEQQQMNQRLTEFLRVQGLDDQAIASITGLISGTPIINNPNIVPDIVGGATSGAALGLGAADLFSPNPSSPLSQLPQATVPASGVAL